MIFVPALAVAFAAFCVWLAVRNINRRERWAKWMLAVVIGVPVLYVASFGPAFWWLSTEIESGFLVSRFYWPVGWIAKNGPASMRYVVAQFATLRGQ